MSKWIVTNFDELNTKLPEARPEEVRVNLFLSPFQTPLAVRSENKDNIFIIEFSYHNNESEFEFVKSDDDVVTLEVGKDSKRIFRILVDLNICKAERIGLRINQHSQPNLAEKLKEQTMKHLKENESETNAIVAERLLNTKSFGTLFDQLAAR